MDVAIENDRGVYLFRPETARGREWLKANVPGDSGQWQPAGWLVQGADKAQALATRLAEAGLEVAEAPKVLPATPPADGRRGVVALNAAADEAK